MSQKVTIREHDFLLHPSGAIYWLQKEMLLIADVHFGKVTHFRRYGAAIPKNASEENFKKLKVLVDEIQPKTVCFLGDLFHSQINSEWETFKNWVQTNQTAVILISGNHDIIPKYMYEDISVDVVDQLEINGFLLTHHPTEKHSCFNFSGHIHPGIRMKGSGRQTVKLACFYKTKSQLILPAFGNFTGKHILSPKDNDEIFAIVENEVICVSK